MRISWGYKIAIFYLSFVAGMLFLVYKATSESFDLVTENYYEAELKYQDVINQKTNLSELSAPATITNTINTVAVQLPAEFNTKTAEGVIYLYRPSDASKDVRKNFITYDGSYELILAKNLSGSYDLKLSWKVDGKEFFQEKKLFF